jgi:hypothetical protein
MEAAGEFTKMKFLAVAGMAGLSLPFTSAECVVVTPAVHPSSDRVRVTALVDRVVATGPNVAFFERPGLRTQTRAFEMAHDANPQELKILMPILAG